MHDANRESDGSPTIKPAIIFLIAVLVVAYAALQLYTIPAAKECLFGKVADNHGSGIKALASCFKTSTVWPALLMAQAALLLAAVEALTHGPGSLAASMLASHKKTLFSIIGIVAVLTLFYLAKGDVMLGDAYLFQSAAQTFRDAASQGIPHHTFYWYGGSAHFEYYGQLYFALLSAADFALKNMNLAIKIVNWLLHIGAAVLVYQLAMAIRKSRWAAFIAAIAYTVSYEHIARIMLHGRLTDSLIFALMPLLLLLEEKYARQKIGAVTAASAMSLTAAAIFLTNPADGIFVLIPLATYFAVRALQWPHKTLRMLYTAGIATVLVCALIGFWAIPFLAEKSAFNAGARVSELAGIKFHPELLIEMTAFPGQRAISDVYYLGIIQLLLAFLTGAVVIKQDKKSALLALTAAAATALILLLFQSPRYAPALVLTLAILAGTGSEFISQKITKLTKLVTAERLFVLFAALIIIDSGTALIQPDYPDFSMEKKLVAENVPNGNGFRVIDLHSNRRTFYSAMTDLATKTESVFGSILEGAPKSTNYALAISTRAAKERYDDKTKFSQQTLDGLYLFNVRYLVLHPGQAGTRGANLRETLGLEPQIEAVQLQNSPVIAAPRIEQYSNNELESKENYFLREDFESRAINYRITDQITQLMGINRETATAKKILVKDTVGPGAASQVTASNSLKITSKVTSTKHSTVRLEIKQDNDAFLQLSYSASPEIAVFVDGEKTPYHTTAINTIAIMTSKGTHTIDIVASPSKLRTKLFIIAISTAVGLLALLAFRTAKAKIRR